MAYQNQITAGRKSHGCRVRNFACAVSATLTLALAANAANAETLVMSNPQEPPNWDYTVGSATAINSVIFLNIMEPLLETQADGSYAPLLASSYTVDETGTEYVFELVEAKFHDGSDFDADDLIYTFDAYKSSPRPEITKALDAVENVEKIDAHSVKVTLSRPSQSFLAGMAGLAGLMVPEGGIENLATAPVGTGPFVFSDWRSGVQVDLQKFADYHGDAPFFDDITVRFIGDETAAINALLAGDIDLINVIVGDGLERVESIEARDGFTVHRMPSNQLNYLAFSTKNEATEDIRVRQAIAHAINREDIAIGAYAGNAEPACLFVAPRNLPWNDEYCPYEYDPDRARELLAEAGAEGVEIELKYYNISDGPPVSEIVTAHLADVGINVVGANRELAAYLEEVLGSDPQFEMTTITGPQTIESFLCPGWFPENCLSEFDALWAQADASVSFDEAVALRTQALHIVAEDAHLIPTVTWIEIALSSDRLEGVKGYRSLAEADLRGLHWAD